MKNKYEAIDKLLLVALALFILMFCSTVAKAQSYTVFKVDDSYEISFIDEFSDQWYLDGKEIIRYGKLNLNETEYKQLIKDIKRTLKQSEKEIDRTNYAVIKYGWVKDSVWVYYNEKAFSVTKKDIDYLNSKL
tara:strand:- start:575 stop:973 length:399 start_codon:yes stop_codon:yes gene_type:complete